MNILTVKLAAQPQKPKLRKGGPTLSRGPLVQAQNAWTTLCMFVTYSRRLSGLSTGVVSSRRASGVPAIKKVGEVSEKKRAAERLCIKQSSVVKAD